VSKRVRKYVRLRDKLAATLAMLLPQAARDDLRAAKVPAKKVIDLFHFDHNILHAFGGSDKWWNLTPMIVRPHLEKSRKDTSIVAKAKRISKTHQDFRRRLLSGARKLEKTYRKRPMPGGRNSNIKITMRHGPVDRRTGTPLGRR